MSTRHVRRLLEEQGRAGLESLGGDDADQSSSSEEDRPARASGFADLAGSDSEDDSEDDAPSSGLEEPAGRAGTSEGGLSMRLAASCDVEVAGAGGSASEFVFEHSPEYAELQRMYLAAVASYDIDAVFRLAGAAPHLVDANLQVCEYFRSIGKLDDAGKALRRALYALERAWHPAFRPWDVPCRLSFQVPQNRAMHTALWRNAQLVGRSGAARTAFSLVRLLRSMDPVRDPMRTALAFDYYALRAGALDSVVAMAHPDPGAGVARDAPSQSAVSSFCDKAHAASPDSAARLGVSAQLFSDPSAWSPIGAAARAVLLHPAAVLALLRELEISSTDTGTAHFGTDTRRGMGTDDADAAAREAPPEGIVVAGSEPAAGPAGRRATERPNPKAIATSVHTVAWQALGRPDVDGCVWAELFSHPFFVLAEREQEASEGAGEVAGSGAAGGRRFDARMGRLVRVFVTRQAALWKDSDALAMLHRAALAAAAAWEAASDADTTGSSEARPVEPAMPAVRSAWLTDSSKREALLGAAFGTAEHAAVCVALADAARTAAYVAGSAALEPPAAPAAAATGAEPGWESIPPLAHYAGAIRAEFSDEVKEVSDEELRAAAGADLPTTGVAAGTGMAEAEAGALGSRLEQLAGQGARLQVGGQDGQLLDVDELLSRAAAMGLSPEELVTAMQTAQLSEHAPVAAAASGALPVDTDPIAAFFQSLLPWVSAPTPHDEAGRPAIVSPSGRVPGELPQPASPIMAPVSDADLAAHLQAAEDFGYLDGEGGDDADASTDDEA
ncbi:hypothetical protein FNF27_00589 [Cafeteria roenbergensis]|uniref:Uncharacterized protein n=1 Tax=Cafeteria roenbergensis TaxID=33653 RepID=A0A5A8EQK2_CAFRO|nr:hypothetical protein FNF27_00589 [Cafeteria roenbergensis]